MIIKDFSIKLDRKRILEFIDCYPDNPVYDDACESFANMEEKAYVKIKPMVVFDFGYIENNKKALFCIATIGEEITNWSTALFSEGNYLDGMLIDAMADDYLFQMENFINPIIIEECKKKKIGIYKRLEAPIHIPMESQLHAWEVTNAKENIGVDIKESFMFEPVKTVCNIFLLEENLAEYKMEHDCRKCKSIDCKRRNVPPIYITLKNKGKEEKIVCGDNQSIMDAINNSGMYINAICGGRGTCGKCKIQVLEGEISPSLVDERIFTKDELGKGYRLSCLAYPEEDCIISMEFDRDENFYIVSDYEESNKEIVGALEEKVYCIGIDIGTTTIVIVLKDIRNNKIIDTYATINKQRMYGADVINRIEASNKGKLGELKSSIQGDLERGIKKLIDENNMKISQITISGNTTMIHLLMGYSCQTLGVFPFEPVNIDLIETNYLDLLADNSYEIPVNILSGISTFVGGDIVSGLLASNFHNSNDTNILIDLGTNGEMAIGNKDKIIVTSTAAGPAFEGGNITCGTASVEGAISNIIINGDAVEIKTIGDKKPIGICGTGAIEATYQLLKNGLIDETGLLDEEYFETGFFIGKTEEGKDIIFTQKDIREIQLAKSAIRAGLETLLIKYGISYEEIGCVYLAGGFGYKMDIQMAVGIGLLPKELVSKTKAVGNTSLYGTFKYMESEKGKENINLIVEKSEEINLSNDKNFNDLYMEYMYFEEV